MRPATVLGLVLAAVSTTLVNLAYLREHDAASGLPPLSLRRPVQSAGLLLRDRAWLVGFAMETGGFLVYAAALALTSLALVQSIGAGGIGVLAFVSARLARRRLGRRQLTGVGASVLGLVLLSVSLTGGSAENPHGSLVPIVIWLAACAGAALAVLAARPRLGAAVADGIAGGLLFAVGDVSTKVLTQGGARLAFAIPLVAGYAAGTMLLQVGYQSGAALTVAGLATLLTNAVPIAAGTVVLNEDVPGGALGVLRVLAFGAVTLGAVLIARPATAAVRRS